MAFWTQADIDKLKTACANGVLTVDYEGPPKRSVTYQNLDAMRRLLAEMRADVGAAPNFRRASFSKGFDPPQGLRSGSGFDDGGSDG